MRPVSGRRPLARVREVSWIRWRLAPTWWRFRGQAVCAEFPRPLELAGVVQAVRADEELRRPLAYPIWKLSPALRGFSWSALRLCAPAVHRHWRRRGAIRDLP